MDLPHDSEGLDADLLEGGAYADDDYTPAYDGPKEGRPAKVVSYHQSLARAGSIRFKNAVEKVESAMAVTELAKSIGSSIGDGIMQAGDGIMHAADGAKSIGASIGDGIMQAADGELLLGLDPSMKKKRKHWKQPPHAFELFFDLAFSVAFSRAVAGLSADIMPANVTMRFITFAILWFAWVENMLYSNFTRGSQNESVKACVFFMVLTIALASASLDSTHATWTHPTGMGATSVVGFSAALLLYNLVLVVAYVCHLKNFDHSFGKFSKHALDYLGYQEETNSNNLQRGQMDFDASAVLELERLDDLDTPQAALMIATHTLNIFIFSIPIYNHMLLHSATICWLVKLGVNFANLRCRQQLVASEYIDPPSPTHLAGRLQRITLIMLAQVFTPAVAVWSKEIAIRRTASEEWSPIPFYGQFGWLNFVVVLDILAVYCVWCLFQHAYQFVVGQNYKGNLYYHIVITGCTTSCIATINGVSSQFYEFAICMTSVDKGGPHCLDATGKRDNLNPVNAVQLLDWTVCAFAVGGLLSWALVLKDLKRMHSKYPGAPAGGVHEQESARKMCRDMMCMYGCAVLITIVPLPLILYGKGVFPKHPEDPKHGYGNDEDNSAFHTLVGVYTLYKLLPVFLVFWERALNRRHRRRLKYSSPRSQVPVPARGKYSTA